MKDLYKYLKESAEDGKNGHYEDFVDEDTGEIVTLWVADPDPEEEAQKAELAKSEHDKYVKRLEAEKKLRKTLDPLEDELLGLNQDLKDRTREYRDLQIDQEEEVGGLYVKGNEAKAEELAQEYGVMSIPCMVLFKDGKEANRMVGLRPKSEIVELFK